MRPYERRALEAMTVVSGFVICGISMVVIAAFARGHRPARLGVLLAVLLLPLPLLVTGAVTVRLLLAFALAVSLARAIDFACDVVDGVSVGVSNGDSSCVAPRNFSSRLTSTVAYLALADAFPHATVPRTFDRRSAWRIIMAAAAIGAAALLWRISANQGSSVRVVARCLATSVIVLALADVTTSLLRIVSLGVGVALRPVHNEPHRSRSVREFWSVRWNLATSRWLRTHCFDRLARRGTVFALMATFAASAALHVYLILVTADLWSALSWAAFFLAQPFLILLERPLGVRRWPRGVGRVWTISTLVLLSPLLFTPALRLFHLSL